MVSLSSVTLQTEQGEIFRSSISRRKENTRENNGNLANSKFQNQYFTFEELHLHKRQLERATRQVRAHATCTEAENNLYLYRRACVCNANKLPLFAGVFSTTRKSSRTTTSLPYTFNTHCTFGGYALEAQVRGKPHFHNALTIVRAAPDWPTLVLYKF